MNAAVPREPTATNWHRLFHPPRLVALGGGRFSIVADAREHRRVVYTAEVVSWAPESVTLAAGWLAALRGPQAAPERRPA